ncbi:sulfonate ABC transporter substrate-binding protein [Ectopseudomonas composti]|uniref:Sulfonate ABC transporter substrate-binding protein n=1 Tax=Ectopseudomonas composti TaxID=658457 RepID=A0ABN0SHI0_9GAMM|nr:aliphatic sulfonate ABC transporter substrate-binding protein [Pseudomonas composti]EZH83958.1 sulfonate ABC transporter substrate-binding protein [Pseudomonas composti]
MKRTTLRLGLAALFAAWLPTAVHAAPLEEVRLDYAFYSPESLVIKHNGWLEKDFAATGTEVRWVLSRGSNNSLEFLNSGASNFALTSSISAFVSRTNGQPVKAIYNYLWSVPSAILVQGDSPYQTLHDLRGKQIAATKGTDPYFFLLRALAAENLKPADVKIVHLQHPEGRTALEQGRVAGWAGLDPHMAGAQLGGARFIYENPEFGLGAFLNTQERFLAAQPEAVATVVKAYERARRWIIANPEEAAQLVSGETQLPVEVIRLQLSRYDFSTPLPGQVHLDAIKPVIPLLVADGVLRRNADTEAALASLIDARIAKDVIEASDEPR